MKPFKMYVSVAKKTLGLAWGVWVLCQTAMPVWAAGAEDPFLYFQEEAQVTAASRRPQKISEAPASAYVISAEEIKRYGYRTVAEALQSVPGVYATNDRNYTYLWFRGFGRPSDYNNRILVLMDGQRVNDPLYGSVFLGNDSPIEINTVDRIEVIKGPSSALYGDGAFLGVVNIVTKMAGTAPLAEVSALGGSYGTHKEFAGIAPEFPNGLKAYVAGSYRNSRGQDLYYPQFSAINGGVAAGSDAESNGTFLGKLAYQGFTLSGNSSSRTKHVPTAPFGTVFNDPGTQTRDTWSSVALKGDHSLSPVIGLATRAYYTWYDYHGRYVYDDPAATPPLATNLDLASVKSYGEEVRARFTPWGVQNAFTVGQEFEKTVQGLQQNVYLGVTGVDVNSTPGRWAVFIEQEVRPTSALSLSLGARYDHYETFGKTINPRFAAIHRLWRDSVVKALYGTAFRAPSAYEMFYGGSDTFLANPLLSPEKIESYEVVFDQQFPGAGMVSVSAYQNNVRHLIDQVTLPDDRIQFQNESSIRSRGLEVSSKWTWNKSLSGFLSYLFQDTHEVGGDRLSNSPVHSGGAGVTAWVEPTKTRLSLQSLFVSARRTAQNTTLPATAIFSFTLRESPWEKGPTLFASLYNLLDTNYSVSGASEHVQDALPQDGRSFRIGMDYKFR